MNVSQKYGMILHRKKAYQSFDLVFLFSILLLLELKNPGRKTFFYEDPNMVYCFPIWVSFNSALSFSRSFCPAMVSWAMRTFLGRFLPEESFWGEVRTGAPVHTVGPQELCDQSGFHVGHSEAKRRVQSTCSGTAMAMVPKPFPSFPSRCLAEIVKPLMRGSSFQIRSTVCSCLREFTVGALCEVSEQQLQRSPHTLFGPFALASHPASVSPAESNALIPKVMDFGYWKHT